MAKLVLCFVISCLTNVAFAQAQQRTLRFNCFGEINSRKFQQTVLIPISQDPYAVGTYKITTAPFFQRGSVTISIFGTSSHLTLQTVYSFGQDPSQNITSSVEFNGGVANSFLSFGNQYMQNGNPTMYTSAACLLQQ